MASDIILPYLDADGMEYIGSSEREHSDEDSEVDINELESLLYAQLHYEHDTFEKKISVNFDDSVCEVDIEQKTPDRGHETSDVNRQKRGAILGKQISCGKEVPKKRAVNLSDGTRDTDRIQSKAKKHKVDVLRQFLCDDSKVSQQKNEKDKPDSRCKENKKKKLKQVIVVQENSSDESVNSFNPSKRELLAGKKQKTKRLDEEIGDSKPKGKKKPKKIPTPPQENDDLILIESDEHASPAKNVQCIKISSTSSDSDDICMYASDAERQMAFLTREGLLPDELRGTEGGRPARGDESGDDLELVNVTGLPSKIQRGPGLVDFEKWTVGCREGVMITIEDVLSSLQDGSWDIVDQDMYPAAMRGRYYGNDEHNKRCRNCNEKGHLALRCPKPKKQTSCVLCGKPGHFYRSCPDTLCYNCDRPGHSSRDCSDPRRNPNVECRRCAFWGHQEKTCPEVWRQFHLTVNDGPLKKGKGCENPRKFCYNCGKKGHFGHDCSQRLMDSYRYPNVPLVSTYRLPRPSAIPQHSEATHSAAGPHKRFTDSSDEGSGTAKKKSHKPWGGTHSPHGGSSSRQSKCPASAPAFVQGVRDKMSKHRTKKKDKLEAMVGDDFPRGRVKNHLKIKHAARREAKALKQRQYERDCEASRSDMKRKRSYKKENERKQSASCYDQHRRDSGGGKKKNKSFRKKGNSTDATESPQGSRSKKGKKRKSRDNEPSPRGHRNVTKSKRGFISTFRS